MISWHRKIGLLALVLLTGAGACGFGSQALEGEYLVVLEGATLIDGTGAPPKVGSVVVIDGERIVAVGDADRLRYPATSEVVDVRGHFLVPGFMDLHAHNFNPSTGGHDLEVSRHYLATMLAYGTTTRFMPGGATEHALEVRDAVEDGRLLGPRTVTAGTTLYRQVRSTEEVRAEVRRQAAAGVDYVKLYRSLTPEMTRAAIEEAHANGVRVIAHTSATPWQDAAEAGIDMLTHAGPGISSLMTPQQREEYVDYEDRTQRLYIPFEWIKPNPDDPAIQALARLLASRNVAVEPTLAVYEAMFWADSLGYWAQYLELDPAPESPVIDWRRHQAEWRKRQTEAWTAQDFRRAKAAFPAALEFTRLLHENGVLLVAGTDLAVSPGISFHRHLELLVAAGIPPSEVLLIATRNGARALGILEETGTVEAGKLADLVLLRGDPTTNISNTRQIEWVMQRGVRHNPTALLEGRSRAMESPPGGAR